MMDLVTSCHMLSRDGRDSIDEHKGTRCLHVMPSSDSPRLETMQLLWLGMSILFLYNGPFYRAYSSSFHARGM
jgi:hypothetical protein